MFCFVYFSVCITPNLLDVITESFQNWEHFLTPQMLSIRMRGFIKIKLYKHKLNLQWISTNNKWAMKCGCQCLLKFSPTTSTMLMGWFWNSPWHFNFIVISGCLWLDRFFYLLSNHQQYGTEKQLHYRCRMSEIFKVDLHRNVLPCEL